MCVASTDKTDVRFGEGITYSFANHVYNEDKKQLTVKVIDKATINNPYDEGLRKLKERFVTAYDFYGGSGYAYLPEIYMLWTQFMYTDPERLMKLWLWRDAMFDSELKGEALKKYDIQVMTRLYGPPEGLDRIWREWISKRKNSFHYIDWGWEQSGDTLWSYGWPGWARYAQTNVRLPLNEKPGKRRWVMDYPPSAMPTSLIGVIKRGVPEPSVGALISFERSHTGKAGLGFGVHGEGDKKVGQKFLGIVIDAKNDFNDLSLVLEGDSMGMPDQRSSLPETFIDAARDNGYKIGMTVKIAKERVEVTLRAGGGDTPLTFAGSLRTTDMQRKLLISEPWAVLSRDGKHGLTIYPDVIRDNIDLSIPAPTGRYRFAGQYDLYGLYRAAWRLGNDTPDSLLALREKMTAAFDKDSVTQKAACDLYKTRILKVAEDISKVKNKDAEYALADILGLSLSLDLDRDSTSAKPSVTAYLRSRQEKELTAVVGLIEPRAVSAAGKTVVVQKNAATRIALSVDSHPAPYAPFLIKAEAVIKWNGLTARVRDDISGCPTIPCWWVIGPLKNRGNDRSDETPLIDGDKVDFAKPYITEDGKTLKWEKVVRDANSSVVSEVVPDFNKMIGDLKDVSTYSITYFNCPTERDAELRIGSDDGVMVWLNGELVHKNLVPRGYDSGQDQAQIHLKAGRNTLVVETTQSWGGWKMGAHLLDCEGRPFNDIKFITE
jgi:hypothetical protein